MPITPQQIYESIHLRQISDWIEPCPAGFRTARTTALTPLIMMMGLVGLALVFMYIKVSRRRGEAPNWFWWFAGFLVIGIIAAVCVSLYRKVIFDLEQGKIYVRIMGMITFQKSFNDFEKFSFDPGYVMNGVDPGGVLYMHFKGGAKMRLVQLRDPDDIKQLQLFVLEYMQIK